VQANGDERGEGFESGVEKNLSMPALPPAVVTEELATFFNASTRTEASFPPTRVQPIDPPILAPFSIA
jgi:hypothetical protein